MDQSTWIGIVVLSLYLLLVLFAATSYIRLSNLRWLQAHEDAVVKAVQSYPNRFTGMFAIDPNSNVLMENAEKRLKNDKLRGILLYPSLYQISVNDEWLYPLYNLVQVWLSQMSPPNTQPFILSELPDSVALPL